jgi:glycosyltransferase involved in cell wall biosynthesis
VGNVSPRDRDVEIVAEDAGHGSMLNPLFTVVIPVYNRATQLEHALHSVLAQTCQDFEIIVVDDGSKDDPALTVRNIGDARIRFIRQDNRGGGAARNRGIDEAHGKYVALLDSDDSFLPHHLETMKQLLAGRSHVLGYAPVITDRGRGRTVLKPLRGIAAGEHMATYLLCDRGFIPTMTMVVDAELARKVRFAEKLFTAEDTDFAIRLNLEGCQFAMAKTPGAIWQDTHDDGRSSAGGRRNLPMIEWIELLRSRIPARAYHGCYGWAIAKSVAVSSPLRALGLYANAVLRGCYRPSVACIVFMQIFLPDTTYRWVSDTAIGWFGRIWDARHAPISAHS